MNSEPQNLQAEMIRKFINELKHEGLLKNRQLNSFQKVESLLYKYDDFFAAMVSKQEQIEELKRYGIKQQSKSITKYGAGSGEVRTEQEKLEEKIALIEHSMQDTKRYVEIINRALDKINDDTYFPIIKMRYFEHMTLEDIAAELEKDTKTIAKHKTRLIRKLSISLFPDDAIREIIL